MVISMVLQTMNRDNHFHQEIQLSSMSSIKLLDVFKCLNHIQYLTILDSEATAFDATVYA